MGGESNLAVLDRARPATIAPNDGVNRLAMLSDQEFETRLQALKVGQERVRRIQKEMMTEDEDYGVIPGTNKPALLKPGAEKICQVYGLVPSFDQQLSIGDGITVPHLRVVTKCQLHLHSTDGAVIGEGIGSANSWEPRYRYRTAGRTCPKCGAEAIRRSKFDDKGWYCFDKAGGCGEQFAADDQAIVSQQGGLVENQDPYGIENTLFKMAEKRAHVDAALRATATSGLFTQDVEDDVATAATPATTKPGAAVEGSAPAQANQVDPSGNTHVKDISTRTGKNARGTWTLYTVMFADGRRGTTFSKALAEHAENAKRTNALVHPVLEKTDKGFNLTAFDPLQKPQEPDEVVSGPEKILTCRQVDTDAGPRWVIQTDKRQLVTDLKGLADTATQARKDGVGLIPEFEVVNRLQGGTVNKLTAWKQDAAPVETSASGQTEPREPGQEG